MKRLISLFLTIILLISAISIAFVSYAQNVLAPKYFMENLTENDEKLIDEGREQEDIIASRVIVKAYSEPEKYGNAKCIKGYKNHYVYEYSSPEAAEAAAEYYNSLNFVEWASVDKVAKAQGYGERMIESEEAIDYISTNNLTNNKMKVAVIDTGIDITSNFFKKNKDNYRLIDSGYNFSNTGGNHTAADDNGHGSIISGIIYNNTDDNVLISSYKALNSEGVGDDYYISMCINLAVEEKARVINLSLGSDGETEEYMLEAIDNAIANGVCVVAASGNEGQNAANISPANIPEVFTVGALDKNGNEALFSNYGELVDFIAPGYEVDSAWSADVGASIENNCGTSFSAPYITAEAAILKTININYTVDEIESILKSSVKPFSDLNYNDWGSGDYKPVYKEMAENVAHENLYMMYDIPENKEIYYGAGMPDLMRCVTGGKAQSVEFSLDSGHYVDTDLLLSMSAGENAEIYYTTDNSYPTRENGTLYTEPFYVDENLNFRAVAYEAGKASSVSKSLEIKTEHTVTSGEVLIDESGALLEYLGDAKNIIIPERIGDTKVISVGRKSSHRSYIDDNFISKNVKIKSLRLPESCTTFYYHNGAGITPITNYYELKYFYAPSLTAFPSGLTSNLIEIDAPNITKITINSDKITELNFPKMTNVPNNAFENCYSLKKVTLPDGAVIGNYAFSECYNLKEVSGAPVSLGNGAFFGCMRLEKLDVSKLTQINRSGLFNVRGIKKMYCPELTSIDETALPTSLNLLVAPKLISTSSMPYCFDGDNCPKMCVGSAFTGSRVIKVGYYDNLCSRTYYSDFFHGDRLWDKIQIYGFKGTKAEDYAEGLDLKFYPVPSIISQPEKMAHGKDGAIEVETLGFEVSYQWYGNDYQINKNGVMLEGDNSNVLNTDMYDYDYYYCIASMSDGDETVSDASGYNAFDLNGDDFVDVEDISIFLVNIGDTVQPDNSVPDFNCDGIADISDLSLILSSRIYAK